MNTPLTFAHEQQYWQQGIESLAGIDEVGMGALAGPVVAAAVVFDPQTPLEGGFALVRDSKTLSAKQREVAAVWIKDHTLAWGIGEASVAEITRLNIRGASHLAMRRAVDAMKIVPQLLLIDGTPAQPHPVIPAVNIVDGDSFVFSIAAASIIAKVHRDAIMTRLGNEYPAYEFASNKGYGSRIHLVFLDSLGPTPHHRPTYAPVQAVLAKQT